MGHEITGKIFESNNRKFKFNDKVSIFPLIPCKNAHFVKQEISIIVLTIVGYGSRQNGGYAKFIDVNAWNLIKIPKK